MLRALMQGSVGPIGWYFITIQLLSRIHVLIKDRGAWFLPSEQTLPTLPKTHHTQYPTTRTTSKPITHPQTTHAIGPEETTPTHL